jgi:hypothetical protein
MATLKQIVRRAMQEYSGDAHNGHTYLTVSPDGDIFTIVGFGTIRGQHFVATGLIARILNDFVIIEHDQTDKPLVDALIQSGIPRENIILAYAGEPVPDATA